MGFDSDSGGRGSQSCAAADMLYIEAVAGGVVSTAGPSAWLGGTSVAGLLLRWNDHA